MMPLILVPVAPGVVRLVGGLGGRLRQAITRRVMVRASSSVVA